MAGYHSRGGQEKHLTALVVLSNFDKFVKSLKGGFSVTSVMSGFWGGKIFYGLHLVF